MPSGRLLSPSSASCTPLVQLQSSAQGPPQSTPSSSASWTLLKQAQSSLQTLPPQSTPVSSWFWTPSSQVGHLTMIGALSPKRAWHIGPQSMASAFLVSTSPASCTPFVQVHASAQGPPQSTPSSPASFTPLKQVQT